MVNATARLVGAKLCLRNEGMDRAALPSKRRQRLTPTRCIRPLPGSSAMAPLLHLHSCQTFFSGATVAGLPLAIVKT